MQKPAKHDKYFHVQFPEGECHCHHTSRWHDLQVGAVSLECLLLLVVTFLRHSLSGSSVLLQCMQLACDLR